MTDTSDFLTKHVCSDALDKIPCGQQDAATLKPDPVTRVGLSIGLGECRATKVWQMLAEDKQIRGLRLPNTLELPPSHTAAMVGHFLNHLYADTLKADHPRHLMALIEKIDLAERQQMKASQR